MFYSFPDIFNTDQGAQFTSHYFTTLLKNNNIKISMDGKGRAFDNIFIERLWRSVKYEAVYIHDYESMLEAKQNLEAYFKFYNFQRHHQGLGYKKPAEIYFDNNLPLGSEDIVNNLLVLRKINSNIADDLMLQ